MEDRPDFHPDMTDCEWVDSILKRRLVIKSDNTSYTGRLWRSKEHAYNCDACKQNHPYVISSLSGMIEQAETGLALEIDEIRGDHMREASQIARHSILSRPAGSITLDEVLLTRSSYWVEELPAVSIRSGGKIFSSQGMHIISGEATGLLLMKNLAKAGRRVKEVFETVHGAGLAWFNVVPDLSNDDEDHARKECVGLVRHLSTESREFAFSAALAAEVFPDMAWRQDFDSPKGIHLGVLYKTILAAARGYVHAYFEDTVPYPSSLDTQPLVEKMGQPPNVEFRKTTSQMVSADPDKVEGVYAAQNLMMEVQTELKKGREPRSLA